MMLGAMYTRTQRALGAIATTAIATTMTLGCSDASTPLWGAASDRPATAMTSTAIEGAGSSDPEGDVCRAVAKAIEGEPGLPGAPAFEANRLEILGRARGEPMVLMREPPETPDARLSEALIASRRVLEKGRPGSRVHELARRHKRDPRAIRELILRDGYAYSSDPHDALATVTALSLPDLFDEPEMWLMRGASTRKLKREVRGKEVAYRYVDGPDAGRAGDLLFGDRVALREEELKAPLHRDMRALADELGFDRARITHRTERAMVAELRFGARWARTVIEADGAALRLGCIAEDRAAREEVRAFQEADAPRRKALARMHAIVTSQVRAGLRFDRPEGETTADRDGLLRPAWATAYFQSRESFEHEDTRLPVFDSQGEPWPPQVCVDFILDTFERASGTWYRPRGEAPKHVKGLLDFNDVGIPNRRAVLAFADFAETQPGLFEVRRFQGKERIPFGERSSFFGYLAENADEVRMGDVVAIHGLKRDEKVHQHAILVEYTDPLTGFAYGLADQMKRPRRRTWEGIMAEAPKRSLLYRVRPTQALLEKMSPPPAEQAHVQASAKL
jgi:hypothetical protein